MTITRCLTARWLAFALVSAAALALGACAGGAGPGPGNSGLPPSGSGAGQSPGSGYPNANLLVETTWLADHASDALLRVIDSRLARDYQAGHIAGSVNVPVESLFDSSRTQDRVDPGKLEEALGSSGIANDNRIVVYSEGKDIRAATLFRILENFGLKDVALLNGGITRWQSERRPILTESPSYPPTRFASTAQPNTLADKQLVLASLSNGGIVRVDARTAQEYGAGHIPGAVDVDWVTLFTPGDAPVFKPAAELQKIFQDAGATRDKEIYTYCQTGQRASVDYFALRLLGYEKVRVYEGSWQEWGSDPGLPVEK